MGPLLASCHRDCSLRQCETDVFFKTHHGLILSHHRLSTQSTKPLGWGGEVGQALGGETGGEREEEEVEEEEEKERSLFSH